MAALGVSRGDPSGRPPEVSFAVLKEAIIARTGHYYYADKDRLLRDRLDRRLKATGCTGLQDYLSLLNHPAAGAAEWQELEAEVTIGETFFFRHTEQFVALRDVILPAIVAQNQATRRLRLWSAGCAVGAEPYSLAILLERLLGEAMRDWTIDIVGSDINHRVLAQARDGRFSNWALRGMAEADRARDFTPLSDQRHWHIADRHRPHVRFVQHNLLTLLDDSPGWDWTGFDLILCRNVLIYFSPDRIAPMMSALARCLSPVGWLMVGHSDAIVALPRDLGIVDLPGTIAFRPPGCLPPPGEAGAPLLDIAAVMMGMERNHGANDDGALAPMPVRLPAPPPVVERRRSPPPPPRHEAATEGTVAAIRALADGGRLQEAAQACAAAIDAHPLDARLHFYDGVIAQAAGQRTHAEAALRRAIYLSGRMVMAHYHLGLLLLDGATPEAGRRIMAQVLKLCAGLPQTESLPESDGLSPRDLSERIEMRLRPRRASPRRAAPRGAPGV
jgi:chemotaxis protein methyltransferase CheR